MSLPFEIPTCCELCPRRCGANRAAGQPGVCRGGGALRVARAAPHHWEEPCVSGKNGSGCVFFAGCNLGCVYCQNYDISAGDGGSAVSVERLAEIFHELEDQGVHNLNLVTGTHYAPWIRAALEKARPTVPVVWNTSGYETTDAIDALDGYVRVYLPDLKYFAADRAERYSRAPDYFRTAIAAIRRMTEQVGGVRLDADGMIQSGVIVRHMPLPHGKEDSLALLEALADAIPPDRIRLSLLRQYVPCGRASDYPEINRRLSTYEYRKITERAAELGFEGYTQERDSADSAYTPPFDGTGVASKPRRPAE